MQCLTALSNNKMLFVSGYFSCFFSESVGGACVEENCLKVGANKFLDVLNNFILDIFLIIKIKSKTNKIKQ